MIIILSRYIIYITIALKKLCRMYIVMLHII